MHPTNPDSSNAADTDDRLVNLLDEYMAALERGERPDREELISQHPEIAQSLRNALMSLEFVTGAASGNLLGKNREAKGQPGDLTRRLLGDYQIIREIGRGGMAVVYEAVQVSLGRRVALKVLPFVSVLDSRQLARFKNEAQAAAYLTHQNIVPVYAVGCERGVHFFAMQFIDGQSLSEFVQRVRRDQGEAAAAEHVTSANMAAISNRASPNSWSNDSESALNDDTLVAAGSSTARPNHWPDYWRNVVRLGIQGCNALDYAHCQGIVHRDIKPSNIMLDTTGNLWITDFGLARIENDVSLTMTGDIVGTLRYMSPEQALAKRPLIDHRSDIYSFGVTLFELLTLEPAVSGQSREEVIKQIAFDDPRSLRRINASIPKELDTIVAKAMSKHPAERYQTAKQMGDDLRRFLDDKPILAKPPSLVHRARKWTRRHKVFVGTAIMGLAISLVVALVFMALSNQWIDQERRAALTSERFHREQLVETLILRSQAIRRTDAAGRRELALGAIGRATKLAESLDWNETTKQRIRNEAIACLATTDLRQIRFLHNPRTSWVDFDRELQYYSKSDDQHNVTIWRVADNALVKRLPGNGRKIQATLFSPNGTYLAVFNEGDLCRVWHVQQEKVVLESPTYRAADFDTDSRSIAMGQSDGSIRIVDLESPHSTKQLQPGVVPQAVRFSPNGKLLAVCGYGSTQVQIREIETDSIIDEFDGHLAYLGDVCWSSDAKQIAVGCLDGRIYLWDLSLHKVQGVMRHQRQVIRIRFSPDGQLLASTGHDGITRLWRTRTGGLLATAKGQFVHFNPAGNIISFQTKKGVGLWGLMADPSLQALSSRWDPNGSFHIAFDPSGQILASAGPRGVIIWSPISGDEMATIPVFDCGGVAFDSSGKHLFTASQSGLFRWPLEQEDNSQTIRCGPPERIVGLFDYSPTISLSTNDRFVAYIDGYDSVKILDLLNTSESRRFKGHPGVHFVTLSSDGRWLATGAKPGKNVMVWEIATGQPVATFRSTHDNAPVFSPDNKWLATVSDVDYRFYEVESWKLKQRIPLTQPRLGTVMFSRDSSMAAFYQSPGFIHLLEIESGRSMGILEAPDNNVVSWLQFSPDGSRLAAAAVDRLYIWNLRHLGQQLDAMNLGWSIPMEDADQELRDSAFRFEIDLGNGADISTNRRGSSWISQLSKLLPRRSEWNLDIDRIAKFVRNLISAARSDTRSENE